MELLNRLEFYAKERGDDVAFQNTYLANDKITYRQLKDYSDKIAYFICNMVPDDGSLVLVYGHKSPMMIASFIGCVKAHHPYCPVDISMPDERVKDIIEVSNSQLMIQTIDINVDIRLKISPYKLQEIVKSDCSMNGKSITSIHGDDVFYIIFTSGSTGKPKGVQITADCLDNFLSWMVTLKGCDSLKHNIFLNQAPFSFDLSVMDIYTSLYTGGTIWSLDKQLQDNMVEMFYSMSKSNISIWVSTPSFVNICLINNDFNQVLLPNLCTFLFCGEVLTNRTAQELQQRFPSATVINTYGPTESTVAVTEIIITDEMSAANTSLPIGKPKPGSKIYILDEKYSLPELLNGEKGEMVICGNTIAKGYLNQPKLTDDKFFMINTPEGKMRAYKTGDEGFFKDGLLYYCSRMDFQLKINGYRIELGDIENNILKIHNILYCVVLPIIKNGENRGLAAFVTTKKKVKDEFEYSQIIRQALIKQLPKYMIPKKFIYLDEIPMTNNGKANRKVLEQMLKGV